jgi:nitronate monooxygenase
MQQLKTRFTERFGIEHPVMLAPMDQVASGTLAAAVTQAGGLGMIGGGYGDSQWLEKAFTDAGNHPVGVGFITWSVLKQADNREYPSVEAVVQQAIAQSPALMMVSFGDAEPIVAAAKHADIPVCWQIQRLSQARQALDAGVDMIVVQGQEAGGHGMDRGLMSLLPAVRDLAGPEPLLLAAGGIADGRGLASALMLGADGGMMGTRFWASTEASGSNKAKAVIADTGGDDTVRTKVFDIARNVDWPDYYTGRVVHNAFSRQHHPQIDALARSPSAPREHYNSSDPDDYATRVVIAGEAADLIDSVRPVADIIDDSVEQAAQLLSAARSFIV